MPVNGTIIPTDRPTDLATFTVKVEGEALPRSIQVLSIRVNNNLNKIPTAKIIIADGDTATATFEQSEGDLFRPGTTVEIYGGYHSEEELLFSGVMISQKIKLRKNGSGSLLITAKHPAYKMTLIPKYRLFTNKSDKEAIEDICGEHDIAIVELAESFGEHEQLVQNDCTDWDFMLMRSEMNAALLRLDEDGLSSISPDPNGEAVLTVTYGSTLMEADLEIDSRFQTAEVLAKSWSFTNQEIIEEESRFSDEPTASDTSVNDLADLNDSTSYDLVNSGQVGEAELLAISDSYRLKRHFSKIRGTLLFQGFPQLLPGDTIEILGMGSFFNGKVFISGVSHDITDGNFLTYCEVGIDPEFFSEKKSHNNKIIPLPEVKGLRYGTVLQLEEDPEGENRILIHIPMMHPDGEGVWARVCTLDAGEGRGSFFLPEIGDEVVLGFVNDDPRHVAVIGMVHSSTKAPLLTASDDNHEKGFITRSKLQVLFNDETNTIDINTPNGNLVVLDEDQGGIIIEDENGNNITLSSDGVNISSCKDIILSAPGDVSVEGSNVTVTADGNFKAEGSGGAEVSTGAVCTIKGSLVKIN